MQMETGFEDAWPICSDWILTAMNAQLFWPSGCWRQVAALPGVDGGRVSLHCFGTRPPSRLAIAPLGELSAMALERLVCRHLHPMQWPRGGEPEAVAVSVPVTEGQAVAPETLPSVFTLAWARELPVSVEMPLSGAVLLCQGVPSPPVWRGSLCCLELDGHRLTLDCAALHAVVHRRSRCGSDIRESVELHGEHGFPVLRLTAEGRRWRALLADVLYSPRGVTLSK
jgi:hypothetical protein